VFRNEREVDIAPSPAAFLNPLDQQADVRRLLALGTGW
jgi:hypothetical protein